MLTAVSIHPHDQTIFILHTHLVVNVLLDAASEKTLAAFARMDTVVKPGRDVTANFTQEHHASSFGKGAIETTGLLGDWWVVVVCRCRVGPIVDVWKLKDHFGGRRAPSIPIPAMPLQGSDLLKGDTLWGRGLGVGGGRLGLVPAGGAAWTGTGTA